MSNQDSRRELRVERGELSDCAQASERHTVDCHVEWPRLSVLKEGIPPGAGSKDED